jgi:hypothetical protein
MKGGRRRTRSSREVRRRYMVATTTTFTMTTNPRKSNENDDDDDDGGGGLDEDDTTRFIPLPPSLKFSLIPSLPPRRLSTSCNAIPASPYSRPALHHPAASAVNPSLPPPPLPPIPLRLPDRHPPSSAPATLQPQHPHSQPRFPIPSLPPRPPTPQPLTPTPKAVSNPGLRAALSCLLDEHFMIFAEAWEEVFGVYSTRSDGYAFDAGCDCESIGENGAIVPPREDRGGGGVDVNVNVNVMGGNNVLGAVTTAPSDPPLPMNTTTAARVPPRVLLLVQRLQLIPEPSTYFPTSPTSSSQEYLQVLPTLSHIFPCSHLS